MFTLTKFTRPARGTTAALPISKSLANRTLLLAALADSTSVLRGNWGATPPDDIALMRDALRQLGAVIDDSDAQQWVVTGGLRRGGELQLGNAGTATRFLTAAAGLVNGAVRISGKPRMHERPIGDLLDALRQLGVAVSAERDNDCPPLRIASEGVIAGGKCTIAGDISSQFTSALLLIAPLTRDGVQLRLRSELSSLPYVAMTLQLLAQWGITATLDTPQLSADTREIHIAPQPLRARDCIVEADSSAAAHVFGLALATSGSVTIKHFIADGLQGDSRIIDIFQQMGATLTVAPTQTTIALSGELLPLNADLTAMPDAAMEIIVLAALARGRAHLTGLHTLRHKECDRLEALADGLRALGVMVATTNDSITIDGNPDALHSGEIVCHDDHRIAMSFAAIAARIGGVSFDEPKCVAKTFPEFWEVMEELR